MSEIDLEQFSVEPVRTFYRLLRTEVLDGNPWLSEHEQLYLQTFYQRMASPDRVPPILTEEIYVRRRHFPANEIIIRNAPVVLDAGCALGSESFLFAALGAKVIAVDVSEPTIAMAKRRQRYYEDVFGKQLDIQFEVSNLNHYTLLENQLSLVWLSGVIPAVPNHVSLLEQLYKAIRPNGKLIVTDMSLHNPLFFYREWRRRRSGCKTFPHLAEQLNFWNMYNRRDRIGSRYPRIDGQIVFDDVQFFAAPTLRKLLQEHRFTVEQISHAGYGHPSIGARGAMLVESALSQFPLLKQLGLFYLVIAQPNAK